VQNKVSSQSNKAIFWYVPSEKLFSESGNEMEEFDVDSKLDQQETFILFVIYFVLISIKEIAQ
jgi:hypothetical protein